MTNGLVTLLWMIAVFACPTAVAVMAIPTAVAVMALPAAAADRDRETMAAARDEMIRDIQDLAARTSDATGIGAFEDRIVSALRAVPRHEFVPPIERQSAYRNRSLPIGNGQTISQPFIVALMSQLLDIDKSSKVLEVGTGSGYQAAVLAELSERVYSIEIVQDLAIQARETLDRLGYQRIETRTGDGYKGWPEQAPFDAILVTAAPDHIPQPLVDQLKPGGRLVIPVGSRSQDLMVITKQADGTSLRRTIVPVQFVPLVRE